MALADQLRLMVITDPALLAGRDPVAACRAAVLGGATMVQVRGKDASVRDVVTLTRALIAELAVPVLVNDRVDVALIAGAAGAHLGQDDVPLAAMRPHVPTGFILGISVGSPSEAERARAGHADYWSIGPCYATTTKADAGEPLGANGFAALARLAPDVPVIGIGGITAANALAIVQSGAAGVAVIHAVLGAVDPRTAAAAVLEAVVTGRAGGAEGPSGSPRPVPSPRG
ncbi:MAG TPA: thiamine phosphate synthase [Gemmatimonadales bacterium]|nr:thiamine phosphate synthase [Gemmatimonadales bacterium]